TVSSTEAMRMLTFNGPIRPYVLRCLACVVASGLLASTATAQIVSVATDLGTLGGVNSCAYGVNVNGQVVGMSDLADNAGQHAFLWTRSGGMIDLGTLGGTYSVAYAINASGQVVGQSQLANGQAHAFSW